MRSARRHSGFTLIEILISIGIMALLSTILVIAIQPSLENAKISATKSIIAQIDRQLQARLQAFNKLNFEEPGNYVVAQARRDGMNLTDAEAKALVAKSKYRLEFPQRLEDLLEGGVRSPLMTAVKESLGLTDDQPIPATVTVSSSELLYLLLTRGRTLGTETYSIDGISSRYLTDEDGDGLTEIRDAWGNEIRFYNAPTRLFRPNGGDINLDAGATIHFSSIPRDPNELNSDPFDRLNRLARYSALGPGRYYDFKTYFSFLLVSSGPDGDLGLAEPEGSSAERLAQPNSLEQMFDNITNHQR